MTFTRDRFTWLAYLMLTYFAYTISSQGPFMPFLGKELDLSYTQRGFHFSAFAIGMVVGGLTADRAIRYLGRYRMFWGGGAGMAIGMVVLMLGQQPAMTILGSFLMGWMGDYTLVLVQSTLADHHGGLRAIALTESNVIAAAGQGLSPLLVGGFQEVGIGWRAALLTGIVFWFILLLVFRKVPLPAQQTRIVSKSEIKSSDEKLPLIYWGFWMVIFMGVSIEWCVAFWGADFLDKVVGLSTETAAILMSVYFIAVVLGRAIGSRLSRRISTSRLLMAAFIVVAMGFIPFWLAPYSAFNIIGLFLAGLGIANLFPLAMTAALNSVPSTLSDRASSRITLGSGFAIFLTPQILGSLADEVGISSAYAVVAVLLVLAVGVVMWSNRLTQTT
jgi:MFS family permease